MFASELSQPNNSALSPFCLSVGDFSRGWGQTPAPVIPSVPTWASMTSGARVFRLPLAPPIGSVDVGEGNGSGFANMGWGAHLTFVFLGTSQRNPQAPRYGGWWEGEGSKEGSHFSPRPVLTSHHCPLRLNPVTTLSKPARILSPGWWILLSIFCLDDFRHVFSWAEENKYVNYLSTLVRSLREQRSRSRPDAQRQRSFLSPSFLPS